MKIKHEIDSEFITICQQILEENLDVKDWNLIEYDDQFQTKKS